MVFAGNMHLLLSIYQGKYIFISIANYSNAFQSISKLFYLML